MPVCCLNRCCRRELLRLNSTAREWMVQHGPDSILWSTWRRRPSSTSGMAVSARAELLPKQESALPLATLVFAAVFFDAESTPFVFPRGRPEFRPDKGTSCRGLVLVAFGPI